MNATQNAMRVQEVRIETDGKMLTINATNGTVSVEPERAAEQFATFPELYTGVILMVGSPDKRRPTGIRTEHIMLSLAQLRRLHREIGAMLDALGERELFASWEGAVQEPREDCEDEYDTTLRDLRPLGI